MRRMILSAAIAALFAAPALATPYASGIQNLGGGVYSFVLNQAADNVTIMRPGDTTLNLGPLPAGTHTFNIGAGTRFRIYVSNSAPVGWTQISSDTALESKYYNPRGVAVNRNAYSLSNFGNIYVSNAVSGTTASPARYTPEGLYAMRADQSQIASGISGGVAWDGPSAASPFKITVAPDDSVYIADWSDTHSGVWRARPDLSGNYDEVLYNVGRQSSGLVLNPDNTPLHGSIPAVWVEGTGANTMLYTMDEDLPDALGTYPDERGDIKRYPIGTGTSYTGPYTTITDDNTPSPDGVILNGLMDFVRADDGSWWVAQYRYTDATTVPVLSHWYDGATGPAWVSGPGTSIDFGTPPYAGIAVDIAPDGDLLAIATGGGKIFLVDISDPNAPVLAQTILHTGSYIRDVAFDAAGNLYAVSNSSETLRIYSPGGDWLAITDSSGWFLLVPEPVSLLLLGLGALALRRR